MKAEDIDKEPSIYMRFHTTLEKAISFCKELYGEDYVPGTIIPRFNMALIIAGLTQDINEQDYLDYHLTWLTGVLCDARGFKEEIFEDKIDSVLEELQDIESNRVKEYVRKLTPDQKLSNGQQYKQMIERVEEMDTIPCIINIFKLYQDLMCIAEGLLKVNETERENFKAYAFVFWYKCLMKHKSIGKNMKPYIKDFFRKLDKEVGGIGQARKKAEKLYSLA